MLDSGVNYLLPVINQALARDEAGRLIGYDFWDMDTRPFDSHPNAANRVQRHGTRTASLLVDEAPFVELVPYRYPRPDMSRMHDVIAHAAEHDVRIIGMPLGSNKAELWADFEIAAQSHPEILFIASAGNNGRDIDKMPVYPAALTLQNMLVVTSADDFVQPAQGVNWGRLSVDYLVPAEYRSVTKFDGSRSLVSGSSYAVARVAALAARYLRDDSSLNTEALIAKIRNEFASGIWPGRIAHGYIHDPQLDSQLQPEIVSQFRWGAPGDGGDHKTGLSLELEVLVLDSSWSEQSIDKLLKGARSILSQCDIEISTALVKHIEAPDYLRDLETGPAKTLLDAVRTSGPNKKLTVVLARDTRMSQPFDAEAFGQGNTRHRPWLTGTVWLTLALQDRVIALAHELFHVLTNSGEHSVEAGNLMLARTTGENRQLNSAQCEKVKTASESGSWMN